MTSNRIALVVLAASALSGCKNDSTLDEDTLNVPSERDAAAPAAPPDAGASVPPFDWTSLFPRNDAGARPADAGPRDAGTAALPTKSATLAPAGGSITYDPGLLLVAARGAVTRNVQLTFGELKSPPAGFAGRAFLIEPPATTFAARVQVAIELTPELLMIAPANAWAVATLTNQQWVPLPEQGNDSDGMYAYGTAKQLGAFALIKVEPRTQPDAAVPDAAAQDAAVQDAEVQDAAVQDAAPDAHVDAAALFCQPGACANGTCVEGFADYGCSCNAGFKLGPDLHSCIAM